MPTIPQFLKPTYEAGLRLWARDNGIPWTINGTKCRIDPVHRHRAYRNYEWDVADFLRQRIQPGMTCFDVGANVGVYVIQFAEWNGPGGKIIAFEPNPAAREVLSRHIAMNNLTKRVTVVPQAVGEKAGTDTLYAAGADGMSRLGMPNEIIASDVKPVQVETTSIDEFIARSGVVPDVLFIDIEGYEFQALQGAKKLIQSNRNLLIVCEMHPSVWQSARTTRQSAERVLEELQLRPVPVQGQGDPFSGHAAVWLQQANSEPANRSLGTTSAT